MLLKVQRYRISVNRQSFRRSRHTNLRCLVKEIGGLELDIRLLIYADYEADLREMFIYIGGSFRWTLLVTKAK